MLISRVLRVLAVPVFVAACAPQPATPVVYGQPIYDKFGSEIVGCESGTFIPGAAPELQCAPPPDDCDPQSTAASVDPNCRPGGRDDNGRPNTSANPQRGGPPPNVP